MFSIPIIIFVASLIAIIWMFATQYKRLKTTGQLERDFAVKDLSYESFQSFNARLWSFWLLFIHSAAIVISKFWARITHTLARAFNNAARKIEERIIKSEKKSGTVGRPEQSVFLTTIKAYKHEIKKLKGEAFEEKPRPREEAVLDKAPEKNRME